MKHTFFPREHGATAMLLTSFSAAAVLSRAMRWQEAAALAAVLTVFALQDPLLVLARQRWVWRQPHPEARAALRWAAVEAIVIVISGLALASTGPLVLYALLFLTAAAFSALAVWVNVRNLQHATLFQVSSALALTSASLLAALSATGTIPGWSLKLWMLLALQAVAGIFTVHARIAARIAARHGNREIASRRRAQFFVIVLGVCGAAALLAKDYWISAASLLAAAAYAGELRRQLNPDSLRMPMTTIGIQALSLSLVYAALVIA